jgi:hypothetical protein
MLSSLEFHKDFMPLRVSTSEIGVDGLKLKLNLSKESLDALLFEPNDPDFCFKSHEKALLYCELERENDHTFKIFIGSDLALHTLCGMCLKPLDIACKLNFSIRMLEKEHLGEECEYSFDSADLLGEEQSVGYFSGKCIDLGVILRDHIFLQMPDYPQCLREDGASSCNESLSLAKVGNNNPFVKLLKK